MDSRSRLFFIISALFLTGSPSDRILCQQVVRQQHWQSVEESPIGAPPRKPSGTVTTNSLPEASLSVGSTFELVSAKGRLASLVPSPQGKDVPYRLEGGVSGEGQIVDKAGNVILESGPKTGIHIIGCEVSPNGKRLLVHGGDGRNLILDETTGFNIILPLKPRRAHTTGFASWHWIGDEILIGESGDEGFPARAGIKGEGKTMSQSRLYLYRIGRRDLVEVYRPKFLLGRVFSISQARSDGHIRLVDVDAETTGVSDLGWFTVIPSNESRK